MKAKFKKNIGLILSSVMTMSLLSFTGCSNKSGSDTSKETIKIGVLTSKSGVLETWGTDEIRGIELGIQYATNGTNEVNGKPIKLIIEDDTSTAGVAVQKAVKLIDQDKVHMLTGGISSGNALAVMEKAAQSKVPYIIESAATDAITGKNFNEYTFRVGRSFRQVTMAGGSYLNQVGKTFYIIAPDNVAGKDFATAWKTDIELGGGKVIGEAYAPIDSTDFTSYLTKIKNAKPDVLVMVIVGDNFTSKLPLQIQELGINQSCKLAADIADIPFLKAVGKAGEGLIGPVIYYNNIFDNKENKWFVEKYKEKYKAEPDLFASSGFTGGIAIVEGLKKTKSLKGDDIVKAFEGLKFNSVKGEYYIRPSDHQTMQAIPVVELKKAGKDYVEPHMLKLIPMEKVEPPVTAPGR